MCIGHLCSALLPGLNLLEERGYNTGKLVGVYTCITLCGSRREGMKCLILKPAYQAG